MPGDVFVATNGPSVAYSILDEPVAPWTDAALSDQNVWVSALDFVATTNLCLEVATKEDVLVKLTEGLYADYSFSYDTIAGDSHFFVSPILSFNLPGYMKAAMLRTPSLVNCFDQAHGLSFLAALVGSENEILRMEPFGYLNPGFLVGVADICNNPFFSSLPFPYSNPMCGNDDPYRSKFSCHFFVRRNGFIFDSCAGPALGSESVTEYVERMVDTSTPNEKFYKVRVRDIYGLIHEETVEGGVAAKASPFTGINRIE